MKLLIFFSLNVACGGGVNESALRMAGGELFQGAAWPVPPRTPSVVAFIAIRGAPSLTCTACHLQVESCFRVRPGPYLPGKYPRAGAWLVRPTPLFLG